MGTSTRQKMHERDENRIPPPLDEAEKLSTKSLEMAGKCTPGLSTHTHGVKRGRGRRPGGETRRGGGGVGVGEHRGELKRTKTPVPVTFNMYEVNCIFVSCLLSFVL
jgi:hypothetical protein